MNTLYQMGAMPKDFRMIRSLALIIFINQYYDFNKCEEQGKWNVRPF